MPKPESYTNAKYRSGLPDECILKDIENFYRVMAHYKMTGMDIELAKLAYCRDPKAGIAGYADKARKIPEPKREWVKATDMVITQPGGVKRA